MSYESRIRCLNVNGTPTDQGYVLGFRGDIFGILEQADKEIANLEDLNSRLASDNLTLLSEVEALETQITNSIPKERVDTLVNACIELKKDLLTRGKIDSKGIIVVDVCSGRWDVFNAALKPLSNQPINQGE